MSSSGNVYKSNFIQFSEKNTRVIDTSALVAKRMAGFSGVLRERENEFSESDEYDGYPADSIDELTGDYPMEEGFSQGLNAEVVEPVSIINEEAVKEECARLLKEADEQAEAIRNAARIEAENIKKNAYEEGYDNGREAALSEVLMAKREFENKEAALREEYENALATIEPKMVDVITSVYEHVFSSNFFSRRDVMVCLINRALMNIETEEKITINVCRDDYDMLVGMKASLFERVNLKKDPEIVQRDDFEKGQAKIETPFGIIDCSIDTELKELRHTLMVLSYEGRDQNEG